MCLKNIVVSLFRAAAARGREILICGNYTWLSKRALFSSVDLPQLLLLTRPSKLLLLKVEEDGKWQQQQASRFVSQ
jgi:hypothetical protein